MKKLYEADFIQGVDAISNVFSFLFILQPPIVELSQFTPHSLSLHAVKLDHQCSVFLTTSLVYWS